MNLSNELLNQQRSLGDSKADDVIKQLFSSEDRSLYRIIGHSALAIKESKDNDIITRFLQTQMENPDWYDAIRIQKGQKVFEKYAAEIMLLLGVMALPYCYAGSPGNKALFMAEKMRNNPEKRLTDTAEFLIGVSTNGSLEREGLGFIHINKTRLIHALARYYLQKGDWNQEWGYPINQEDMAGTNLAFSYIILNGLRKSGYSLSDKDQADYMYLWKYIGYQLGISEDLLPDNYMEGFKLANLIKKRNFKYSEEGVVLAQELMKYYEKAAPGTQSQLVRAQVRYFLGNKIAGQIGLDRDPVKDTVVEVFNGFSQLQNSFSSHKSSYGEMIRNFQFAKKKMSK